MKDYNRYYIDGAWVEPIRSTPFELIDPATERPFAVLQLGGVEDVDRAVRAARRAFPHFSATSRQDRIALLERIIDRFQARESEIMHAISREMGAPLSLTGHTGTALSAFRQAVATLRDYEFETRLGSNIVRREAIGC